MGEEEGCENRKSDVTSLRRKLNLHPLVYIIDLCKRKEKKKKKTLRLCEMRVISPI
jgi:hypothetical protein